MKAMITKWLPKLCMPLLTVAAVLMTGSAARSQVLINEDFSSATGATPPTGWVNNLIGLPGVNWRFNNPGSRTISGGTPGFTGQFAIMDSDNLSSSSGEDAALESPSFDASLPGTYKLEFDNQFRSVTATAGTPKVEVWNGTAWVAVLTLPFNVDDGYPNPANHKSIDITAATGGSTAAKVRFHWVDGSDDWWWAVDNVTLNRLNCTAPAATYTIVPNCASNQFSVNVNITSMGNATSIAIKDGTTTLATATATGSYVVGPFASGTSHTLTLEHNVNTLCTVTSPAQTYLCNDECSGAVALTVNPTYTCTATTNGTTVGATQSSETPPTVGATGVNDDVWYSFTATSTSHRISLTNVTGIVTDMAMAIYSGNCGSLVHIQSSDPDVMDVTGLTVGQTYKVRVYTYTSTVGSTASFTICVGTPPPPPPNDNCGGAVTLTVNPTLNCVSSANGTTLGATQSSETAPTVGASGVNDDVWYSFTATGTSHVITLTNVNGNVTDMAMAIYSGNCGSLVHIQSSDPNTMIVTGLTAGQVYKVRVYTYSSTVGDYATFTICVGTVPTTPPANDNCAGATTLTVNPDLNCGVTTFGTTAAATQSTETAPTVGASGVNDDVWYSFTATATTHVISLLNITGVVTDMAMAVYSGNCGSLVHIQSSDPETMTVTGLTVGQVYKVRVYTYTSTAGSWASFNICVGTMPPPPANDDCNNAVTITQNTSCVKTAGTTASATLSMAAAPCSGNPDDDVWYSFIATGVDAQVEISEVSSVIGSSLDMYFQVLSGACGSQTSLLCSDPNTGTVTGLTPGARYYIRVYTYGSGDADAFKICVTNITAPVTCGTPLSVTVPPASITANSATINWTAPTIGTPTGYQWEVRASGAPGSGATGLAASGTVATTTVGTGTGLSSGTTYSVYVRTNCGGSDNSGWSAATVFTTLCNVTILTKKDSSRCETGTVVLEATTAAGNAIKWYAGPTGGPAIGSGSPFTTPSISTTTTYYVGAETVGSGTTTIGSGTSLTGNSSQYYPTAFMNRHTQYWHQMVFTAAELSAAGLVAGNITALKFNITALGSNANVTNFSVAIGTTASTTLTGFTTTGLTPVYGPSTYTTAVGVNTITFTTPYPWNGTSNIIIDMRQNGVDLSDNANTYCTPTTGNTTVYAFTSSASPVLWTSSPTANTSVSRLNTTFVGQMGCGGPRVAVVATVRPRPDTTVTMNGGTTICQGKSVTMTAASGTGITYQWLLNNSAIPGANNAAYTATAAGSYRVLVSNGSCSDTSNARTITVIPIPSSTVTAGGPTTFCSGRNVVLSGPAPVTGVTYQWQLNAANIGGATAQTYTATASGTYRLILANGSCADTSTGTTVTVNPSPTATVTAAGPVNFCNGGSVVLNANTGTGFTYQWQRNSANIGAATSSSYTVTTSGDYRVIVSNGTCTDTSVATTVTVNPAPAATITPAGPTTFCQGGSVVLNANTGTGLSYQWKNGGTDIPGATTSSYTATASGSYTVVVTQGCATTATAVTVTVNLLPTATATAAGPLAFCQGGSVVLNANTGTGLSYQWLRNNAIIAGANTASYTATLTGNYRVRVTRTATGCSDTSVAPGIAVNVTVPASATVTQTGTSPICQGGNIRFQAATGTGYTYQWYKDGLPIAGATTSVYFATTTGAYHVVIVNGPCTTTTTDRNVVVNPLPPATATAAGPTAFCEGGSVIINAPAGTGLNYQWFRNATLIAGANTAAYTATQSGIYTVTVTNSATNCSATSAPVVITVSTLPVPVVTPQGPTSFCQGGSVVLDANTATGYTYQWYNNGVAINGATASSYTAATGGYYTVEITNGTCVALSTPVPVTIIPAPPATITAQGPTAFCQGNTVVLQANNGTGLSYQWTRNGINIPGATGSSYTAAVTGTYTVNITDGTCPATATPVTVTVNPFPVAVITVTGGVNMSTGVFATYQWYHNGVAIPGATAQSYTATHDGFYNVVVRDTLGCTATSPVQTINTLGVGGVPGADQVITIWPNPTDGLLHIETKQVVDVTILSVDGKEVMKAESAKQVDATPLAQGLYMIRIVEHKSGRLLSIQRFNKR